MSEDFKVRVLARGTALVPNPSSAEDNVIRRHVGRLYQETAPKSGRWAFVPTGKLEEVKAVPEIARALADGDLWAADSETAKWAEMLTGKRVTFDPLFGGEKKNNQGFEPDDGGA